MNFPVSHHELSPGALARTQELFKEQQQTNIRHTDRLFVWLMILQWLIAAGATLLITPRTWNGTQSSVHLHVYAAFLLGGLITSAPVFLALKHPGKVLTRHTISIGQMLMSALLIHLTGGRIETHFHVFGSLAILAFYRDWRVLISASAVVYADHVLRGMFWPQSVYGVLAAPVWRSFEHAGWVMFEVTFLIVSIRQSLGEMLNVAERQARLEMVNDSIEQTVLERTEELRRENAERRQAEAHLKRSQSQLREAQQIARLGSWEWDVVENKVYWSDETMRLYGYRDDQVGSNLERAMEHIHPEDRNNVRQALYHSAQTGAAYSTEHRVIGPDDSIRVMHGMAKVVTDENGKVMWLIGTSQDITEIKQAQDALRQSEEKLRQSQKMEAVGRLAGGVAHDFNNLLTVINGYCGMSLHKMDENDALRKNIEEVEKAAERAASLTSQLLAFSRKQVLKPTVLNLNLVVQSMEKMLRRLIGEDVELTTLFDEGLGSVKADAGQLEQVILNMAVNARDAMPRGGKLTIRTVNVSFDQNTRLRNRELELGDYVLISISDTGVGMTEEVQAHLFEPFFTTKGVGRGTGLGLATSYGIISQSGGDIGVYSEPNCGTTFKIYLPRVDAVAANSIRSRAVNVMPQGHETVLLVEDESAVRRLASTLLGKCGYQVVEACDGSEAYALIEGGVQPDLVLTDVIMPKMSGRELYDRLKRIRPGVKVLFMSGYTDDALALHGVLDDQFAFIEKPFSPSRLACKVRETIDGSHQAESQLSLS